MMSSPITSKKLILVIGATGAQGLAVIDKLLEPSADGSPSPYAVRAFTRNLDGRRAKELAAKPGVEVVKGSFDDFPSVYAALQGVYGAWVNTDGFTVGETREVFAGMRIFELAKQVKTVRHYVWSNLDYSFKKGGYDPKYRVEHYDGKGRVADWMKAQPSVVSDNDMSWSVVTSGPYMDMLNVGMFGPVSRRPDGTFIFATPIGHGHVPMIALSDLGFFARYTFDHRAETSAQDLEIASDWVGWDYLLATFTRVTGLRALVLNQTLDEWFKNWKGADNPVANENRPGDGSTTWRQNFSGFWAQWRDDVITRDMEWIRKVNPYGHTLERWMRETGYKGEMRFDLLKNAEDGKSVRLDHQRLAELSKSSSTQELIVHHLNDSRSQRILWLLEELEVPYEIRKYQRTKEMVAPPELKAVNPIGTAPVITDGTINLAESGAIVEYIIQKYGNGKAQPPESGKIDDLYFVHYAEGSLMPLLVDKIIFKIIPERAPFFLRPIFGMAFNALSSKMLDPRLQVHAKLIEDHLVKSGEYFAARQGEMLGIKTKEYVKRIHERAAYKRALEKGGEYSFAT
ncbi:Glutathione S-transferase 3 [Grifola frondosa]|uniref:glutathione transferase n=1 Tax=Grifola frondosa TaxID=5627 RepID=A0A1C7LQG1_GRIFR|nr:Glutathione S-transferase 3 [Grifola frondosa]